MKSVVTIYEKEPFKTIQSFFFKIHYWKIERTRQKNDQEDDIILGKLSLTTTIKRENRGPVWDKPVPDLQLCFYPNVYCDFVSYVWLLLENSFPTNGKVFSFRLAKRVYLVSLQMHNKSAQRKPAKHKKTSCGKISKRSSCIVS